MQTLSDLLDLAAPRHGVASDALPRIRDRAEGLFPGDAPAAPLLDRWLVYLRESEPYWFTSAPTPPQDYSHLPAGERLFQWRQTHPPQPKHPPVIFSPAQVQALAGLRPQEKLTRVRELAAAIKGQK